MAANSIIFYQQIGGTLQEYEGNFSKLNPTLVHFPCKLKMLRKLRFLVKNVKVGTFLVEKWEI